MKRVIVVGGGVFGQTAAAALRMEGRDVIVYDSQEPEAGSIPSGGLMKPSWLSMLSKQDIDKSLDLLNVLFGVADLEFKVVLPLGATKTVRLQRLNMAAVLAAPTRFGKVVKIAPGEVVVEDNLAYSDGERYDDGLHHRDVVVVCAAGYWSKHLLDLPDMRGKKGISYNITTRGITGNTMLPWAPYKQIMAIDEGDGSFWCGDGTAIKVENWHADQEQISFRRIKEKLSLLRPKYTAKVGIRPVMKDGYQQLAPDLFLCTGAGKNGSAMAGVYARKIAEALR